MRIAVLGATGLTGRALTTQALARGYQVTALARDPARLQDLACPALTLAQANVRDPESVHAAVEGADALVSGLGVGPSDPPETLVEGARVAVSAGVPRIIWLGALGTGASRGVAGPVFGPLLGWTLRREFAAKVEADGLVVASGATVVHAGRLTNTPARHTYVLTPAGRARPRLLPPSISRADVAALMLDEAVAGQFLGETVVALPCVGYFRNLVFAQTGAWRHMPIPFIPRQHVLVITCIDPRVDPAAFLRLELGDAVVLRNAGGRVNPAVIKDVAYISYLVETKAPDGPWFEVAVIHHTDCGAGFLADDTFRHGFAARTGYGEEALAAEPVIDPAQTVRPDVERLLSAPQVSPRITVSGHVYDVRTGLVSTVVAPTAPERREA